MRRNSVLSSFFAVVALTTVLLTQQTVDSKVALVLSGGGAKGAFEVGVLQYMCETNLRNKWDMVLGTSIGAMNAAGLAQFNKAQQCSHAVPTIHQFWATIKSKEDIFTSWSWVSIGECLNPINFFSLTSNWYSKGGMCSTKPGQGKFFREVNADRIRNSDMQMIVSASALNDAEKAQWFTNRSPNVLDYAMGSAALTPLFPPVKVNGMHYIDGGFFHNVPLVKAIEEGATEIYVILLSNLGNSAVPATVAQAEKDNRLGPKSITHIFDVISRNLLLTSDVRFACLHTHVKIHAVIPERNVGETIGFTTKEIEEMRKYGYDVAKRVGYVDLCQAVAKLPGPMQKEFEEIVSIRAAASSFNPVNEDSNTVIGVGLGIFGIIIGALLAVAVLKRREKANAVQISNDFHEIPSQPTN